VLIIIYLKTYFGSCLLRCLRGSTATKISSGPPVKMGSASSLSICHLPYSPEQRGVSPSTSWAAANMPWDSSQRLGRGTRRPSPVQVLVQPGAFFFRRSKQGMCGRMLPQRTRVMPGLHKHQQLRRKSPSSSKARWLTLTPAVEPGNLSLPLPSLACPRRQGSCPAGCECLSAAVPAVCQRFPR